MPGVFISYRRDDCAGHAGRLYDRLADRIGESAVFMDVGTIEPGADFGVRIEEAISSCLLVIVLIGDDWLEIADSHGRRRLDDPTDLVRHEVASALRRDGIRVIPVLVEGAAMPPVDRLPDDLKELARRNALELSDVGWRYDVERLIAVVERTVAPGPRSAITPPAETSPSQAGSRRVAPTADGVDATRGRGRRSIVRGPGAIAGAGLVLVAVGVAAVLLTRAEPKAPAALGARVAGTQPAATQPAATQPAAGLRGSSGPQADAPGSLASRGSSGPQADAPRSLASRPNGIAVAANRAWVLSRDSRNVSVVAAKTTEAPRLYPVGVGGTAIAAGFGSLWVVKDNATLLRVTREGQHAGSTKIRAAGTPVAVVTGAGVVWVGVRDEGRDGTLVKVDPRDLTHQQSAVIAGGLQNIAVGKGAVWVTTSSGDRVIRVDARNLADRTAIRVGRKPAGVTVGEGAVWVANSAGHSITPIDPATRKAGREISLRFNPSRVATGGGSVWATAQGADTLVRIDARRPRRAPEEIATGSEPYALDVTARDVWLTLLNGQGVQHVRFDPN